MNFLHIIYWILLAASYQVSGLASGTDALKVAASLQPDLILLDVSLPDLSGYEVCQALKTDARTRQIPVIFISVIADRLDRAMATSVGGAGYHFQYVFDNQIGGGGLTYSCGKNTARTARTTSLKL